MSEREKIKELLSDFIESPLIGQNSNLSIIDYNENPLSPDLIAYCFREILHFNVKFRLAEKVNYCIDFKYKETYGSILHTKMSFKIFIDETYKKEIICLLTEVKLLLRSLFSKLSRCSIENNEFSMINHFTGLIEKFDFYKNKINLLHEKLIHIGPSKPINLEFFLEGGRDENNVMRRATRLEIQYCIEAYIDTFFSMMEHTLTLLYPFVRDFDASDSYGKLFNNSKWNWGKKINDIFGDDDNSISLEKLREIKEIYRNRITHGYFSREFDAFVQIDNFGQFPLYCGKNYLDGFYDEYDVSLDYDKFLEFELIFNNFLKRLDEKFMLPMLYIKSGLPVQACIRNLVIELDNEAKMLDYINRIQYELDNQTNMDW